MRAMKVATQFSQYFSQVELVSQTNILAVFWLKLYSKSVAFYSSVHRYKNPAKSHSDLVIKIIDESIRKYQLHFNPIQRLNLPKQMNPTAIHTFQLSVTIHVT